MSETKSILVLANSARACKWCVAGKVATPFWIWPFRSHGRDGKAKVIRDQCQKAGVAFHFKQWGGVFKKRNGRLLEGRTWDEMPAIPVEHLASRPTKQAVHASGT